MSYHFSLDYRGFILFPTPVLQLRGLVIQGRTVLTIKDWVKEGIKFLSLFLTYPPKGGDSPWPPLSCYAICRNLFYFLLQQVNSTWALALLIFSLQNLITSLQSSGVACPFPPKVTNSLFSLTSS